MTKIIELFPDNVVVTHLPKRTRSGLLIDRSFMVSILLCRTQQRGGGHSALGGEADPCGAQVHNLALYDE